MISQFNNSNILEKNNNNVHFQKLAKKIYLYFQYIHMHIFLMSKMYYRNHQMDIVRFNIIIEEIRTFEDNTNYTTVKNINTFLMTDIESMKKMDELLSTFKNHIYSLEISVDSIIELNDNNEIQQKQEIEQKIQQEIEQKIQTSSRYDKINIMVESIRLFKNTIVCEILIEQNKLIDEMNNEYQDNPKIKEYLEKEKNKNNIMIEQLIFTVIQLDPITPITPITPRTPRTPITPRRPRRPRTSRRSRRAFTVTEIIRI